MADDGDPLKWIGAVVLVAALAGHGGADATAKPVKRAKVFSQSLVAGPPGKKVKDPTGTGGRITVRMLAVHRAMTARGYRSGSCWDAHEWNPSSDHPKGRACDYFFNHRDPAQVRRGWQAANWLTASARAYGVKYVIWQGRTWSVDRPTWKVYRSSVYGCPNRSHVTGCHYDHIHVSVR